MSAHRVCTVSFSPQGERAANAPGRAAAPRGGQSGKSSSRPRSEQGEGMQSYWQSSVLSLAEDRVQGPEQDTGRTLKV